MFNDDKKFRRMLEEMTSQTLDEIYEEERRKKARHVGAYLKEIRQKCGLSLREAGELSGLSYSYISMLEKGKKGDIVITVSPQILEKLAEAYNHSYADLLMQAGYYYESQSEREKRAIDVKELLLKQNILSHNGRLLDLEDVMRIMDMIDVLFKEYDYDEE